MKKSNYLNLLKVCLLFLIGFYACAPEESINDDSEQNGNPTLTIENLTLTISVDENIETNTTLGTIVASTTLGTITYTIKSTNPENAIIVDDEGIIKVGDTSIFDFETNPTISAIITVNNGTESKEVEITITLKDIDENTLEPEPVENVFTTESATLIRDTGRQEVAITVLGNANEQLIITIGGGPELPTTAQTYSVSDGEAFVGYSTDVSSHLNYFSLPNTDKTGEVTLIPKENGLYAFTVKDVSLTNFFTKAELTISQAGEVEYFSGSYSISNTADYLGSVETSHHPKDLAIGNAVWKSSEIILKGSTPINNTFPYGASGHLRFKFPLVITTGEYDFKTAEFSPAIVPTGECYLTGATHGGNTNVVHFNATSGKVVVTEASGVFKFTFSDVEITFDEDPIRTETLNGVAECRIEQ